MQLKQDVTVESTNLALKNSGDNVTLSPISSCVVSPSSTTNDNRVFENSIVMDDQQKEVNETAEQAKQATTSTDPAATSSHDETNTSSRSCFNSSSCSGSSSSSTRKAEGSGATNVTQIIIGKSL